MKTTMPTVTLDLSLPRVMAIVNVTPDSFFAASRVPQREELEQRVRRAVDEGAAILDVGGYSSRPGAAEVSLEEEWRRVAMGVEVAREVAPEVAVSVDTFRSEIVRRVVESYGEVIVNDISAGELDAEMIPTVARLGLWYVAMHMKGTPQTMQQECDYRDGVVREVVDYFSRRTEQLMDGGISRGRIILDPGFGFAKTADQNFELLASLHRVCDAGLPVLAGLSRKSMIYSTLNTTPEESLAGTVALGWEALRQGAKILRVHDVRQAVQSVQLFNKLEQFNHV